LRNFHPGAHPASYKMGTGSLPGFKSGWGVTLSPHPLLVPWSWKSRAIPLFPLWSVRPVQSLSACTRDVLYLTCNFQLKIEKRTYTVYKSVQCSGSILAYLSNFAW